METFLWLAGIALLLFACAIGVFSLVLGLPGTFIIVAATLLYAWLTDFAIIAWTVPLWLLGLAIAGEILELAVASASASSAATQPNRRVTIATIAGAIIGGIVGTPFLFGIGSLIGAMAGAFVGAAVAVSSGGGTWADSLRTGMAAMRGRLFGFVLKSAIAVTMVAIVVAALFR